MPQSQRDRLGAICGNVSLWQVEFLDIIFLDCPYNYTSTVYITEILPTLQRCLSLQKWHWLHWLCCGDTPRFLVYYYIIYIYFIFTENASQHILTLDVLGEIIPKWRALLTSHRTAGALGTTKSARAHSTNHTIAVYFSMNGFGNCEKNTKLNPQARHGLQHNR